MAMSRRENEIKLAFPSAAPAIRSLLDLGAQETHPRAFEDNFLFDSEDGLLRSSGRLLRLRRYGTSTTLTFKAPVEGVHRHKLRVEHETTVSDGDAVQFVLEGLGLRPVYRYQKFRTVFRLGELTAAVDETPLGTFVELEGEPADVDRAARAMGFDESRYVLATYRELQEADASARGVVASDLVFTAGDIPS